MSLQIVDEAFRRLVIARDDFGVAEPPAVDLAHEAMMGFLMSSGRVHDIPSWLDGAIWSAAEAYLLHRCSRPLRRSTAHET